MNESRWEHFHHEADIGVRGFGVSPEQAFEQAGLALTAVVTDLEKVSPKEEVEICCETQDMELLFADWLNAVIFEMATRRMLFRRYSVSLDGFCLRARVWGEKVDVERHQPVVEIKGATYTELKVENQPDGSWMAQCVVDV